MSTPSHDTRRLYHFEEVYFRGQPTKPIATLRKLGERIWQAKSKKRHKCIPIIAGQGFWHLGRYYSYCDGSKIVLARNERKTFVLIHEMTHALGYDYHDKSFVKAYLQLLIEYDKSINKHRITKEARKHKIL